MPGRVTKRDMVAQVERIGYGVVEVEDEGELEDAERAARQAEIRKQERLLLVGVLFSLPLFVLSMLRDFSILGAVVACSLGQRVDDGDGDAGTVLCGLAILRRRL